ncbi:ABC transporter permease [bacterium]|nr:ABC transporter permease [bacterium]
MSKKRIISAVRTASEESVWREVWAARSIWWLLVRRDLRARYAGSMLGVMWNVIHPVIMVAIYILILGTILGGKFGAGVDRSDYVVHLVAGIIPWLVFQEIVLRCSGIIPENAVLIKKVAFPEVVLHLTVAVNTCFIHFISYTALVVILSLVGGWPGSAALVCYVILLAVAFFALGIGLTISVFNIYFRDVGQVVSVGLQFLFWFTPIVYWREMISGGAGSVVGFFSSLMEFNPVFHFTAVSQWIFGDGQAFGDPGGAFSWTSALVVVVAPVLAVWIGLAVFNRFKRDILDHV